MKTTIWISVAGLALAAPLLAQTDLDTIGQLRQLQIIPLGAGVSAIPTAGEVAPIGGKPYSAIGRTVTYSPDGAHVDRSDSTRVYRDEQGRTRREMNDGRNLSIIDPVAGVGYNLQTESKTAVKRTLAAPRPVNWSLPPNTAPINLKIMNQSVRTMFETVAKMGGINLLWDPEMVAPLRNQFTVDLSNVTLEQALDNIASITKSYWKPAGAAAIFVTNDTPQKREAFPGTSQTPAPKMSLLEAAREQAQRMSSGGRGGRGGPLNATVDDLGTQIVNGISAQGVRTTSVIPTGTFGNDHDIKTVTERWVSEELHVLVKSVYTDSRSGATMYDLINISQAPPDPSLFQVPAGYTMQEGGRGGRGGVVAPVQEGGRGGRGGVVAPVKQF